MLKNVQMFSDVALKVTSTALFNKILENQQNTYDTQFCKIENPQGQVMLKLYSHLCNRSNFSNGEEIDKNNWNQSQRRIFVWFIICYTYFLQIDKKKMGLDIYEKLSPVFFGKNPQFLHFQHLNLLKSKNRVSWSPQEDQLLTKCINQITPGKWNEISKKLFYDSNREIFKTPKHCRQRWLNHLDKNKKHGEWTSKEDLIIFQFVLAHGKRWSKIVPLLNQTRTQHMIKNRYNSLISKSKGIKKMKEEQIAKNIFLQLSSTDQDQSRRQSERQSNIQGLRMSQKHQNFTEPNQQMNYAINNSPVMPFPSAGAYNTHIQMENFLNYNYFFYPPLFFNQEALGCSQLQGSQSSMFSASKNSKFSIYQPQIRF